MITGLRRVGYNLFNHGNLSTKQETRPPYNPHDSEAKWLHRWNAVDLYQVDLDLDALIEAWPHASVLVNSGPIAGTPTNRAAAKTIEWLAPSEPISHFVPGE